MTASSSRAAAAQSTAASSPPPCSPGASSSETSRNVAMLPRLHNSSNATFSSYTCRTIAGTLNKGPREGKFARNLAGASPYITAPER